MVEVECHAVDHSVTRSAGGRLQQAPQGGGLGRQIEEVVKRAGEQTPVIVRSTDFPSNPKAAVSRQLGELITGGGRRVVVQDSDWRTMMALARFRQEHGTRPELHGLAQAHPPLDRVSRSMRAILDLDRHNEPPATSFDRFSCHSISRRPTPIDIDHSPTSSRLLLRTAHHRHDQRPARRAGNDRARRADAARRLPGRAGQRQDDSRAVRGRATAPPWHSGDSGRPQRRSLLLRPAGHGAARGLTASWPIVPLGCAPGWTSPCTRRVGPTAGRCRSR